MKKITIVLIALALVCSSVFAGISVTAGAGFGGQVIPKKDCLKEKTGVEGLPMEYGYSFGLGAEYEMDNNYFVYSDTSYNLITPVSLNASNPTLYKDVYCTIKAKGSFKVSSIAESLGVGYAFHFNQIALMIGGGVNAKMFFAKAASPDITYADPNNETLVKGVDEKAEKMFASIEKLLTKTIVVGANLRIKGTYFIDNNWGVSFQFNPSFDFKVIGNSDLTAAAKDKDSETYAYAEGFSTLFKEAKLVSGNACIGITYKF